jgi:hypothetical protein
VKHVRTGNTTALSDKRRKDGAWGQQPLDDASNYKTQESGSEQGRQGFQVCVVYEKILP